MANESERVRYPWDKWFKSKRFTVVKGTDFNCQTHSMMVMIRTAASSRDRSIRLTVSDNQITVIQTPKGRKP